MKTLENFIKETKYRNGLYISVIPNMNDLNPILDKIQKEFNIEFVNDFHITVIYSNRVIFDEYAEQIHQRLNHQNRTANIIGLTVFGGPDSKYYLVLLLKSKTLDSINKIFVDSGYKPKEFENYQPHITIAKQKLQYDYHTQDLINKWNKYFEKEKPIIHFGKEILENLDD